MKAKLSERYKGAVFANASSLLLWRAYLSHLCSEVALFKINHVAAEYSRAFDIFNRIKVRPDVFRLFRRFDEIDFFTYMFAWNSRVIKYAGLYFFISH